MVKTLDIDIEALKLKVIDKLRPSGWVGQLKGFIHSEDFDKIITDLVSLKDENKRFTPPLKQVFRAFEECPYDNLKVVFIGQDPYSRLNITDGLAFSSQTSFPEPLNRLLNAVQETVYPEDKMEFVSDLSRWANQGVLLLNVALTSELDKSGKHFDIWKHFMAYTMDMINSNNAGLIFVFFGQRARTLADLVSDTQHHKFYLEHPASPDWSHDDIFNRINVILKDVINEKIIW